MPWSSKVRAAVADLSARAKVSSGQSVILNALDRAKAYAEAQAFAALDAGLQSATDRASDVAGPGHQQQAVAIARTGTLLLKPVGDICNLGCPYCYEAERRVSLETGRMKFSALRAVLDNLLPFVPKPFEIFIHGGEPLLAGMDYFQRIIDHASSLCDPGDLGWGVQTNGVLLDDAWAGFLKENNFMVGLSLDGPPEVHDNQRPKHNGEGSHTDVVRAIKLLQSHDVAFGVTTVVTPRHALRDGAAAALFEHFRSIGVKLFDAHPAFTPSDGKMPWNLSPVAYSDFMLELFDAWVDHGDPSIKIRSFDEFFKGMTGFSGSTCFRSGRCINIIGVDPDGTTSACTRPFDKKYNFGNLGTEQFDQIVETDGYRAFVADESAGRERSGTCQWTGLCGSGGCPHERMTDGAQDVAGKHVYCTCHTDGRGGFPALFHGMIDRVSGIIMSNPSASDASVPMSEDDIVSESASLPW
ncbi:MAG: radical SAM protein [Parvularculaceae bacterium]